VRFENIDFRYAPELPKVLDRFSRVIGAGEACAIMGVSGSGKSTLLGLLMGMLAPTSGTIRVGGKSTDEYFADPDLRLGFVGPEPFLIEGTVRENLLYGVRRPNVPDDELLQALRRAQLDELLAEKPGLLDHALTEAGEGLSTGQKQRLMFARAILVEPTLLVLDEASSNLDERTEALLSAEIQRMAGRCTILVITHRPAFVKWIGKTIHLDPAGAPRS
jgi:ABC-type bacteriocin/lantibiotic exporter with double-glycine peptidase domain